LGRIIDISTLSATTDRIDALNLFIHSFTLYVKFSKDLAELYPAQRDFLLALNDLIYDLKEVFSKGYYIHLDSHGSSFIINVSSVLVPEFD